MIRCSGRISKKMMVFPTIAASLFAVAHISAAAPDYAAVMITESAVFWNPHVPHASTTLTVSKPGGEVGTQTFTNGSSPVFSLTGADGQQLPDGSYNYELTFNPVVDEATLAVMLQARDTGNANAIAELRRSNRLPQTAMRQSGHFLVLDGAIVTDIGEE